jgi:hypothetical protein
MATQTKLMIQVGDEVIEAKGELLNELNSHREEIENNVKVREAERATLEAKKLEVLAKLGLTQDEVTALLA